MINAGAKVLAFNGQQMWNATTSRWDGIFIEVAYPAGQNSTNNPIMVGDFLVEQTGRIWKVEGVQFVSGNTFNCSLAVQGEEASDALQPDLGITTKGAISTPINGNLLPYWDATYVADSVARAASKVQTILPSNTLTAEEIENLVSSRSIQMITAYA